MESLIKEQQIVRKIPLMISITLFLFFSINMFIFNFVSWQINLIFLGISFIFFGIAIDTKEIDPIQEMYERANNPINKQIV